MLRRFFLLGIIISMVIGCATMRIRPPTLIEKIEPEYPREAQFEGLEGNVGMHILISDSGVVKVAKVKESSGHPILDEAAIEYTKKLRFHPAIKNGNPIAVWLTWQIKFRSRAVFFIPIAYAMTVQELIEQVAQSSGEERKALLQEILYEHERYVRHMTDNPELENNNNEFLKKFILPEVYQQWLSFWKDWPLLFVVYHDFITRYPNEFPETSHALNQFLDLLMADISRVKQFARFSNTVYFKKNLFLEQIYRFLDQNYPDEIPIELQDEAKKYIKKNLTLD